MSDQKLQDIIDKLGMYVCIMGDFPPTCAGAKWETTTFDYINFDWRDKQTLGKWIVFFWHVTIPPDDWADFNSLGDLAKYIAGKTV